MASRKLANNSLLLYFIICLVLNDEANSAFEVKKVLNPLSWETASHHCKEIRGNLTFAVPAVNLSSMTLLDEIGLQREAWVGYFQTYEHFLFIVCVPLSEIESSVSDKFKIGRLNNRPGMCYSLCGLQGYIGLQDDLCYCIETRTYSAPDIQSVHTICENPLPCANGMLCGILGYNQISVYKNVSISSHDIKGNDSGCFIVTKRREYEISVANCTSSFQHLCEAYTGLNLYLEESPNYDHWVNSFRDCPKTGKKPTTFIGNRTNLVFPNIDGSWWTSVVRDLVIRNCSECKESTPEVKGAEETTRSKERASTMMSTSTHETTTALLPSDVNISYGLVGVSVILLGALVVTTSIVCVFRRRPVSQEHVQEFALHSTREQHALLETQITHIPSEPPI